MTLFLPLDPSVRRPQTPSFLVEADREPQLAKVVQAIMKAKRIVVICGAGISVQAGIPDFRSQDGLFQTLKRDNPRESLSSGKDLFDASVFNTEAKTTLFCQMMAQLADLSQNAEPTSFHHFLRALNDRGRLLRVYTQNIDAIEEKCGLSFGVPEFDGKKWRGRPKGKTSKDGEPSANNQGEEGSSEDLAIPTSTETPRCIPLHGTLQQMHCQICRHSFPLQDYLPSLNAGQPPQCPECTHLEKTRAISGKRLRGVGKLRPSVVLYNEAHHNGEGVGDVVQKDLIGSSKGKGKSGADLLLVVGTSLKVPGTKRMVREFAKAVKARGGVSTTKEDPSAAMSTPAGSAPSSSRQSPSGDDEPPPLPMKAFYLNLDFPVPTREWEGVFDAWVQGDAQTFADMLRDEFKKEAKLKEQALERRRRREEESAAAVAAALALALEDNCSDVEMQPPDATSLPTPQSTPKRKSRFNMGCQPAVAPPKRQKLNGSTAKGAAESGVVPVASSPHSPMTSDRPTTLRQSSPPTTPSRAHGHSPALPTPETTPYSHRRPWGRPSNDISELPKQDTQMLSQSVRTRFAELWSPSARSPPHYSCPTVTSSIRSTLLDHEREFALASSPLVQLAHRGFRGNG